MKRFKFLFLILALLLGVSAIHAQAATATDEANAPVITLERTACFGSCPVYTVEIYADGTVKYNGEKFVQVMGEQTSQIDPQTVAAMVEAFYTAGYFDWNDFNSMTISDQPSTITSVTRDGVTHRIDRYGGDSRAPLALIYLEQWVDLMANTAQWTGVKLDVSTISNGAYPPVVTLQTSACFGKCPVYTVAAYADGTVAYMGIANVKTLGVQIIQMEDGALDSIIRAATSLGYFDWQDSYTRMVRTDQATVITSITTPDVAKQITRYEGDPNAPVGLLWVEQSIEQLASNFVA